MGEMSINPPESLSQPQAAPFTIAIDTREQQPYTFAHLTSARGNRPITIPTLRATLHTGDYMVFGHPRFVIERKSKADLWGSIVKRANFEGRLARMVAECDVSAVVIEAELSEILQGPPPHTRYPVKSVLRTVQAWTIRYPTVHWCFLPGRVAAERWAFRLLEKYWESQTSSLRQPRGRGTP